MGEFLVDLILVGGIVCLCGIAVLGFGLITHDKDMAEAGITLQWMGIVATSILCIVGVIKYRGLPPWG